MLSIVEALARREKSVVVVDDDRDLAELVQTVLLDEGFNVNCLYVPDEQAVRSAIDVIEPDCVILDGGAAASYGPSWELAAWLASRPRPIAAVMFTAHSGDREEVIASESDRAKAAKFAATVPKPFDIDQLIAAVHAAVGQPLEKLTDEDEAANQARLLERLRAAGAQDLIGSQIGRTWATFRIGSASPLYKIYRWRAAGVYFVGRYSSDGRQMEPLGQFASLDALLMYCVGKLGGARLS